MSENDRGANDNPQLISMVDHESPEMRLRYELKAEMHQALGFIPRRVARYSKFTGSHGPYTAHYAQTVDNARVRWTPIVATGKVRCVRCRKAIHPDQPWEMSLGHGADGHDSSRARYKGPEHADCHIPPPTTEDLTTGG